MRACERAFVRAFVRVGVGVGVGMLVCIGRTWWRGAVRDGWRERGGGRGVAREGQWKAHAKAGEDVVEGGGRGTEGLHRYMH